MIGTMLYDSYTQALGIVIAKVDGEYVNDDDWWVEWLWDNSIVVMSEGGMGIFIRDYQNLKKNMR